MNRNVVQLGQQLLGIWKHLGLNQRLSVVLAAGVVLAALLSLGFWSSRVDYGLLYGRLDDGEAAKVVAYLDETKVPHKIGQGGSAIYVPRDKVHYVRMQLASRGIPRGDGVGFDIFDKANFGISDFVQRVNYIRAVQGELARTIAQLEEVESARVTVVMPENRLLVDDQKKPKAAVLVRTRNAGTLSPSAVNSIRFLVANSVEGLQQGQVTIADTRGNLLSENTEADSILGLSQGQLKARRELEQYLSEKAEKMLAAVLGPGQAVVRVSADINTDNLVRTEEKFDPDGQVMRSTTTTEETTQSTSSNGSGAPGVTSNLGLDTNVAGVTPVNNNTKKNVKNLQYEINKVTSNLTQVAGGLKRLTAAVFIAARMEGAGAERKAVPRTPEELQKLRRVVQNALGIQINTDGANKDDITLEEMPFSDQSAEVAKDIGQQDKKQFWFNQVQTFLYPGLALGVLFVFWRLLKRTPAENMPVGIPLDPMPGENGQGQGRGNGHQGFDRPRSAHGAVTPEVLNRLVRENPENFTQAIQNWLGRGASHKN